MNNLTSFNITILDDSVSNNDTVPYWAGFLCIIGSSIFWPSIYIPVKHFDIGDGIFYQFMIFVGLWLVGFVVNCIRKFPIFYAVPLLGGVLNTSANLTATLAVKLIGIGLATTLWNLISLITGWSTSRFGLLGLEASLPSNSTLNIVGVAFAILSLIIYGFVQSDVVREKTNVVAHTNDVTQLNNKKGFEERFKDSKYLQNGFFRKLAKSWRRIIGILLVVLTGFCFGVSYNPVLVTSQITKNSNFFDFWFSYYTGSLVSSIVVLIVYSVFKKNKPSVNSDLILPGLASGLLWAIGDAFYFISTGVLSQTISYPLTSIGPPFVSLSYGIFVYKEIKGVRNFITVLVGFGLALVAAILIGFSF